MSQINSLNELYFIYEMREMCEDVLSKFMNKMGVSGEFETVDLPNGGARIVSTVRDMNMSDFWDSDTGVMKVFIPDLYEQLEKINEIRELNSLVREQKNAPYSLSGLNIDELPVMTEIVRDYYHFTGKKPASAMKDLYSDVEFGMEISYDPLKKQGSPFMVSSSCALLCGNEIKSNLKSLMSLGMDKKTAMDLHEDFRNIMTPANSFLVGGNPPESMEEFRDQMAEGITSAWLVTDIVPVMEDEQSQRAQM